MESKYELVIPNDDLPFKMFLFEGKDGNYRRASHWHRSLEIFLVMKGTIDFCIQGDCTRLEERDFVIVNSNEVHSIDAPCPNRTLVLQIPVKAFEPYLEGQPYMTFSRKGGQADEELFCMAVAMYRDYEEKSYGYELKVMGLFRLLQYLLLTRFRDQEVDPLTARQKAHLDKLSEITGYMKDNYNHQLSLEAVADRFGFSPSYLSRIFTRYANISYRAYLTDLRMEYAVKELLHTDHEIGDIAVNHGFSDSRAFAKAFAKRYGCRPSEYRKSRR